MLSKTADVVAPDATPLPPLSRQEVSVLMLATSGLTSKEISLALRVSANTVKYHLSNIYRKLRVHTRAEAVDAYHRLLQGSPAGGVRAVLDMGTRLASQLALSFLGPSRAAYLRVDGSMLTPLIELDPSNTPAGRPFPLAENHHFSEIVNTRKPRSGIVGSRTLGPTARATATELGVTAGAGVPIVVGDSVHGVLAIGARGTTVPPELLRGLIDLGHLVELALANAAFRQDLQAADT
ncbi:MAG TPA: LuxR C-terminal-related transcriptional regulator [Candidatus Dormibacteraeota bacterium]|nr:LuxR C-terminal-related transcriptional regulator [Candidatus Dormibacteraeota bacterium]